MGHFSDTTSLLSQNVGQVSANFAPLDVGAVIVSLGTLQVIHQVSFSAS